MVIPSLPSREMKTGQPFGISEGDMIKVSVFIVGCAHAFVYVCADSDSEALASWDPFQN